MPRQKVDPRHRQRVAQACDSCKRRKEKCNGALPCEQCKSRRREDGCCYTKYPAPSTSRPVSRAASATTQRHSTSEVQISLTAVDIVASSAETHTQLDNSSANSAPMPRDLRMLEDCKGRFIYVGESASLSFLQTVRSAVTAAVGPCAFTTDPLRHLMVESTPPLRFEMAHEISLDLETALCLADQYFLAVSGTLDLFDPLWLSCELPTWVTRPLQRSKPKSAIIYLALAIGAQGRARDESDELIAEQCFAYGRQLAMFTLMDDSSLSTVQAFTLITYYMIAACRRNAAFTNLGVAVRAAYALGIHRHETNAAFIREEGISRERAWKTLRVCDLFLSASMGRPPATSETFCNIPWASLELASDRESSSVASQVSSAIFRICNVFERILVEVYSKNAVTFELARSISKQHRQWTEELPRMLRIDGLEESDELKSSEMSPKNGSGIVTMAYYYSIVLLTRPFLTFQVCNSPKTGPKSLDNPSLAADLSTYADACVDSAIKGINIAHDYVFEQQTPRRQPLVINSVFISALCLGMAYFGDYDQQRWPLGRSMERVMAILTHFGPKNPQSARYSEICRLLKDATARYIENRDASFLQLNNQSVRNVFGDVRASAEPRTSNQARADNVQTPQRSDSNLTLGRIFEPISLSSLEDIIEHESIIPTSGIMLGQSGNGHSNLDQDDSDMGILPQHFLNTNAVNSLDGSAFDDIPLFSLTNDLAGSYFWQ